MPAMSLALGGTGCALWQLEHSGTSFDTWGTVLCGVCLTPLGHAKLAVAVTSLSNGPWQARQASFVTAAAFVAAGVFVAGGLVGATVGATVGVAGLVAVGAGGKVGAMVGATVGAGALVAVAAGGRVGATVGTAVGVAAGVQPLKSSVSARMQV
jgi:hypothetical protein